MKKATRSLIALFLLLACVCSFASCAKYEKPTLTDTTYDSTFTGLHFTSTTGWDFYSEEEIAEMMELSKEYLSEEQKAAVEADTNHTIYDMYAVNLTNGYNAIVMCEEMKLVGYTVKKYAEKLFTELEQTGIHYQKDSEQEVTFCGESYYQLQVSYTMTIAGITTTQMQRHLLRKIGSYMICVSLTAKNETELDKLEKMFSAYQA